MKHINFRGIQVERYSGFGPVIREGLGTGLRMNGFSGSISGTL
jgi:hypothetical protein